MHPWHIFFLVSLLYLGHVVFLQVFSSRHKSPKSFLVYLLEKSLQMSGSVQFRPALFKVIFRWGTHKHCCCSLGKLIMSLLLKYSLLVCEFTLFYLCRTFSLLISTFATKRFWLKSIFVEEICPLLVIISSLVPQPVYSVILCCFILFSTLFYNCCCVS